MTKQEMSTQVLKREEKPEAAGRQEKAYEMTESELEATAGGVPMFMPYDYIRMRKNRNKNK